MNIVAFINTPDSFLNRTAGSLGQPPSVLPSSTKPQAQEAGLEKEAIKILEAVAASREEDDFSCRREKALPLLN